MSILVSLKMDHAESVRDPQGKIFLRNMNCACDVVNLARYEKTVRCLNRLLMFMCVETIFIMHICCVCLKIGSITLLLICDETAD